MARASAKFVVTQHASEKQIVSAVPRRVVRAAHRLCKRRLCREETRHGTHRDILLPQSKKGTIRRYTRKCLILTFIRHARISPFLPDMHDYFIKKLRDPPPVAHSLIHSIC
jgi:hypothetical protein